ncbi:MAG: PcfB family protein, partial [Clostridiales bacterium]|nr:PcfB family protein [Clostridiales bacterium]
MQEQKSSIRKALAAFRDKAKQLNADRQKVRKHI